MYVTVIKQVKCDICIIATKKALCNIIKGRERECFKLLRRLKNSDRNSFINEVRLETSLKWEKGFPRELQKKSKKIKNKGQRSLRISGWMQDKYVAANIHKVTEKIFIETSTWWALVDMLGTLKLVLRKSGLLKALKQLVMVMWLSCKGYVADEDLVSNQHKMLNPALTLYTWYAQLEYLSHLWQRGYCLKHSFSIKVITFPTLYNYP